MANGITESNFSFLRNNYPELARIGGMAEQYNYTDRTSCFGKLRVFTELFVHELSSVHNIYENINLTLNEKIKYLKTHNSCPIHIWEHVDLLRKEGNNAVHANQNHLNSSSGWSEASISKLKAKDLLKRAHDLGEYLVRQNPSFDINLFTPWHEPIYKAEDHIYKQAYSGEETACLELGDLFWEQLHGLLFKQKQAYSRQERDTARLIVEDATFFLNKAIHKGSAAAALSLAKFYSNEFSLIHQPEIARKYFTLANKSEDVSAIVSFARYLERSGCIEESLLLHKKAAEKNHIPSIHYLINWYASLDESIYDQMVERGCKLFDPYSMHCAFYTAFINQDEDTAQQLLDRLQKRSYEPSNFWQGYALATGTYGRDQDEHTGYKLMLTNWKVIPERFKPAYFAAPYVLGKDEIGLERIELLEIAIDQATNKKTKGILCLQTAIAIINHTLEQGETVYTKYTPKELLNRACEYGCLEAINLKRSSKGKALFGTIKSSRPNLKKPSKSKRKAAKQARKKARNR